LGFGVKGPKLSHIVTRYALKNTKMHNFEIYKRKWKKLSGKIGRLLLSDFICINVINYVC